MTHKIMAYGTLQRNFVWWERLLKDKPGVKFCGKAVTVDRYYLFACGIPYLSKTGPGPGTKVRGEVFEVDDETLEHLDRLEGHPNWYTRTPIKVSIRRQAAIEVEAYFINVEPTCALVESGDYRVYAHRNDSAGNYVVNKAA